MGDPVIIAVLTKNGTEDLRVALDEFKGHNLLDLRVFAEFGGPAKVKMPTKKGLSLRVEMLPDLIAALQAAQERARGLGLIPAQH